MEKQNVHDVMLSYASENRDYVKKIAEVLQFIKIDFFYDEFHTTDIWGESTYFYFDDLVTHQCKYIVIFISEHYVKKVNTTMELKATIKKQVRLID